MGKRIKAFMKITIFLLAAVAFCGVSQGQDLDNYKWRSAGELVVCPPLWFFRLAGQQQLFRGQQGFRIQ